MFRPYYKAPHSRSQPLFAYSLLGLSSVIYWRGWVFIGYSDRKSTRLNSSHTVIYTLSLHDALPISLLQGSAFEIPTFVCVLFVGVILSNLLAWLGFYRVFRSEEHTSELQSHSDLHSFPTRRSSDLPITRLRIRDPNLCLRTLCWGYPQ